MRKSLSDLVVEKRQEEMMQDEKQYKFKKTEITIRCRVCGTPLSLRINRDTCAQHISTPASIAALEME
jgi:rubrerythrin